MPRGRGDVIIIIVVIILLLLFVLVLALVLVLVAADVVVVTMITSIVVVIVGSSFGSVLLVLAHTTRFRLVAVVSDVIGIVRIGKAELALFVQGPSRAFAVDPQPESDHPR